MLPFVDFSAFSLPLVNSCPTFQILLSYMGCPEQKTEDPFQLARHFEYSLASWEDRYRSSQAAWRAIKMKLYSFQFKDVATISLSRGITSGDPMAVPVMIYETLHFESLFAAKLDLRR